MTSNNGRAWQRWMLAGALMLLAGTAGCGRKQIPVVPEEFVQRCLVLERPNGAAAAGWSAWLHQHMPASPRLPAAQLEQAISKCLAADLTLVISHAVTSGEDIDRIEDYFARGGRALFLGREHARPAPGQTSLFEEWGEIGPVFTATSSVLRAAGKEEAVEVSSRGVLSPVPHPRGSGGERAGPARWIPVIEAAGAHGGVIAWPGSVWLVPQDESGYAIAGWLAIDPRRDDGENLVPLVTAMAREVTRRIYLKQYGLDRYSVRGQTPLQVSARMIDRRERDLSTLRLVAEWINRHGQEIRRHVSPPLEATGLATTLNVGLAPEPSGGQPESYRLRLLIRDRNDQRTHESVEQIIKVFPRGYRPDLPDPITAHAGQLMQGRRPVFMLGVHYWPRGTRDRPASRPLGHWLDPENFDAAIVTSDLDLMTAAGVNSLAIEYTDIAQAPQLVYLLEELRRRSMWANVYMPALYPLDLRLDEAIRMLQAAEADAWPEWYAIEIARGLTIKPQAERRRLDPAWAEWVDEHFNSPAEAEQKLGAALWRERGRLAGPPDAQLRQGPHRDLSIALYHVFLRDYVSRRMGVVRQTLRSQGYNALLTARSAYGWPSGAPPPGALDVLDLSAGAIHQDFLSPDAWTIHPLVHAHADGDLMAAYVRGAGGGKPVVWAAYGQHVGTEPNPQTRERQKEVYQHFLGMFTRQGASGAYAWWYPSGAAYGEDWGLVTPDAVWRPVEEAFRSTRLRLRQTRLQVPPPVRQSAPLIQSASQWTHDQRMRLGLFAKMEDAAQVTEWTPPGAELDSAAILSPQYMQRWSEIDGLHLLNAEWGEIRVANSRQARAPGENVRTYTDRDLQLELINSGTVRWVRLNDRRPGSIWLRISQPGHADEWIAAAPLDRGGRFTAHWRPRSPGLWEIQPHLVGYGKFGERLRIEVTTPPTLF